jgi:putative transposase
MRTSVFTEEAIFEILKKQLHGEAVTEICLHHNISQSTFFEWKNQYQGMNPDQIRRFRILESEKAQWARRCRKAELQVSALKNLLGKKF